MTRTTVLAVRRPPSQYANRREFAAHVEASVGNLMNTCSISGTELAGQFSQTESRFPPSSSTRSFIELSPSRTSPACGPSHV